MFGYGDEELLGRSILEAIHHHYTGGEPVPQDQCKVYRAVVYGETTKDFVWQVFRKDGSQFYALCSSAPLYVDRQQVGAIFFAADITLQKQADDALRASAEKLQLAADVAAVGFYDYYPQTGKVVWTDTLKKLFGLGTDTLITFDTLISSVHPDDRERVATKIHEMHHPESGGRYQHEYRVLGLLDGKERWFSSQGQVFYDEQGKAVRQIGAMVDITQRKQSEVEQWQASQHCPLTGLPNRALLAEYAEHLLAMAERDQANSAILFIDLDRFKPINDLYGHAAGDKVLQEVARRIRQCTRKEDIISRLGGDEFVVFLPHIDTFSDPQIVARHLIDKIGQPIQLESIQANVSASIGVALFPKYGRDLEALIRCVDLAMYAAKRSERGTYRMYIPDDNERSNAQLQLEMHIQHALESNHMALFYQPIVDLHTGQLTGVEALIRLVGINGDLLPPEQFIPAAEAAGLIDQLGRWVVTKACRQHQAWRNTGLPPISIAINISSLEFRQRAFAEHLAQAVADSGMDPTCLQIELTESAVMENIGESISIFNQLRSLGVRVALDDFGTGYSSLSYLSNLPLDKLKIDQSFVSKLDTNRSSQAITDTIIGLGILMKLEIVGEGIESVSAMEYLRDHGCHQGQGFLYSQPLPPDEFESWYRTRNKGLH